MRMPDGLLHKVADRRPVDWIGAVRVGFAGRDGCRALGQQILARRSVGGAGRILGDCHNSALLVDTLEWASACDL